MSLKLVTPPEDYPITLDEAKAHLRVDGTDEDDYITLLIGAATEHVQNITNRQLMEAEYLLSLPCLPSSIKLPRPPFAEISSITAKNENGDVVTFEETDYTVSNDEPAILYGVADSAWFASSYTEAKITYTAGYPSADYVPKAIKSAIFLIIGHLYTNREEVIVGTINSVNSFASDALLAPYRIFNA